RNLADTIKETGKNDYIIIIRSTIVPTTARNGIIPLLKEILSNKKFSLCIVPEFLREGQALSDFMNPDKIVIGHVDERGKAFVEKVFDYFKEKVVFISTNLETAEMIKYTNNAFFSTLISFANEIANICEKIGGVDAYQVMNAMITDKRITTKIHDSNIIPYLTTYLIPGCGFGGSCFPKDVRALTQHAHSVGAQTPLLESVLRINDERPEKIVSLAESLLGNLKDKQISVLGLAFKPDTDDIRSSPAVEAIKLLKTKGAKLSAYDPKVNMESIQKAGIANVLLHSSLENCLKNSSLAILFTKWQEFEQIDSNLLDKYMKKPLIIDGRGFLDSRKFQKNTYFKIGYTE
ncbi:MAG: UDP-glucose/GDP-mannose dehydrogenase family protein, partial [Patescibacteria group bacterium]|nr:UDP-glucose/GDP-mannose dehydrogenase family protein [Patescibacteria group bacterium]